MHNPTYLQLDEAYRSIPFLGSIQVESSNYEQTIQDLERVGFVAIELISFQLGEQAKIIRAFKGKHGPCFFNGKKVGYTDAALAALDDDNHLLLSNELIEVCDKTYKILQLNPYKGKITTQESNHPNEEDVIGSGDFEASLARLYDRLKNAPKQENKESRNIFYPGPFRVLILRDGLMVHRGQWCNVPLDLAKDLKMEGCQVSPEDTDGPVTTFQESYEKLGSACMLTSFTPEVTEPIYYQTDLSKLDGISRKLRERLLDVINNHRKHFILIGNDIKDEMGCCPSEEVTEANNLVKHGVLSSLAEPVQGDSCPVTMFAFKDELSLEEKYLSSRIDDDFRNLVLKHINKQPRGIWKNVMKWTLLIFIISSLGIAARKCQNLQQNTYNRSISDLVNALPTDRFMVILFHNEKRCYQCLEMEEHTVNLLRAIGDNEPGNNDFRFSTIIIDDPENRGIIETFGIFAPTIVLLEFDQNELTRSKVLPEFTGLYRDERLFTEQLLKEMDQFRYGNE